MIRPALLVLIHVAIAVVAIGVLYRQYDVRETEAKNARRLAAESRAETTRMQRDNHVYQHLRQGLAQNDPYVVELIARERLRLARPGELAPPPLAAPAIDKAPVASTTSAASDVPVSGAPPRR